MRPTCDACDQPAVQWTRPMFVEREDGSLGPLPLDASDEAWCAEHLPDEDA